MCLVAVFWLLFLKTGHKNAKFGPQKTNCIQKLNRVRIGLRAEGRRGGGVEGWGAKPHFRNSIERKIGIFVTRTRKTRKENKCLAHKQKNMYKIT